MVGGAQNTVRVAEVRLSWRGVQLLVYTRQRHRDGILPSPQKRREGKWVLESQCYPLTAGWISDVKTSRHHYLLDGRWLNSSWPT